MGWQDDTVVQPAAASAAAPPVADAARPAWAQDEVVAPAAATPPPATTAPPAKPSLWQQYLNSVASPVAQVEGAASIASNLIAAPVSGVAGLAQGAWNAAVPQSMEGQSAADRIAQVGNAMTYQPRTEGGQAIASTAAYPFEKLAQGADWAGQKFNNPGVMIPTPFGVVQGGPALATAVNTGIQSAPSMLLEGARGPRAAAAPKTVEAPKAPAPREIALKNATDAGFKLTPTQAGSKVGGLAEGLTGQAKLERSISLKNAPRVNELVATEIGLPEGTKSITRGDLTRLKVEANKPYNELSRTGARAVSDEFRQEVAGIGDKTGGKSFEGDTPATISKMKEFYGNVEKFSAEDAVNKIRKLRRDGYANKSGKYDPEKAAIGDAQLQIADALDNELGRHAEALGKPELVANYKAARVQLAKLATVENALRGSDVSALALAKAQKNGAPLSGKLKTIADSATEFEKSFQEVRKIRDQGALGVADYLLGVGGATASPALATAVLARPIVRAGLASKAGQRAFVRPKSASQPKAPAQPSRVKPVVAQPSQQERRAR